MMEDNEARLKATIEASENEVRDMTEFFTGKIREAENELHAVRQKFLLIISNFFSSISYVKKVVKHSHKMKSKRKISKLILMMNI